MIKFFFFSIVSVVAFAVAWYYLPERFRAHASAFMDAALRQDAGEVKGIVSDMILPRDPEMRRAAVVEQLKKNFDEIKKSSAAANLSSDSPLAKSQAGTSSLSTMRGNMETLVSNSEKLLDELEETPLSASVGSRIVNRVLGAVLPPGEVLCKNSQ